MRKRIAAETSGTKCKPAESQYKTIIRASMDGFWIVDAEGNFIDVNDSYCHLIGYNRDELLTMKIQDVEAAETREQTIRHINKVMKTGNDRFETRHRRKDGGLVDIEVSSYHDDIEGGRFFVFLRDISERKKAEAELKEYRYHLEKLVEERTAELQQEMEERKQGEQALRASEEKFHAITNTAVDAILLMDNDGKISYWNTAAENMFGYTTEEAINRDLHKLLAPGRYREDFDEGFNEFRKTGQGPAVGNTLEFIAMRKDGTEFPMEVSTSAIQIDGRWCAVGIIRDVTERKKAEDAIRTSEAELHDSYFTQSTLNMILSESLQNISLEKILQKALNMILAIPWPSFEAIGNIQLVENKPEVLVMKVQTNMPEELKKARARVPFGECLCGKAALTQEIQFSDYRYECYGVCHEDMSPYGHYAVPILFGGNTLGVLNIFLIEGHIRDQKEEEFLRAVADTLAGIIMRKRTEDEKDTLHQQLLQAQKIQAVGELAGGVAHDFNNILTAMVGYGSLLKMKMKGDDPLSSYADHILSLSGKAANLTQSLLAFSRKQIMNPTPVDINQIIGRSVKLLSRVIREDIELKTVLTGGDLTVMADSLQIEQAFLNLATNARDAMPRGGTLEIRTEIAEIDETFIRTHGYGKVGSYALITVSDTGIGMDEMTRERIFEPFFTTKEVGKGTGLGLSMVYGIIKQHEGFINVYSEPGKGTIFRIYLPLIQAKAEEARPEVIETVKRGTETILLTDDNSEVRASTKAVLADFGYKIIEATDGEDAISKFNQHKDEIQLLIFDVIMPKKNGREAYEEIRKSSPGIKAIFTSGYAAEILYEKGILFEGPEFIHKPIVPKILLRKVREVLDE